jgi:DNA polymerase sigma
MEHVCSIADLLAKSGMERVVCVSSAKVPIVKIWDSELQVACDINVNNPLALENTQLVRTYVEIDARVRPLAMIIKHWAKRRILNDAGMLLGQYLIILLIS